jgi:hypothetical protein
MAFKLGGSFCGAGVGAVVALTRQSGQEMATHHLIKIKISSLGSIRLLSGLTFCLVENITSNSQY